MLVLYNQEVSALKTFTVNFHQEDNAKATTVHKLSEEDFNKATEKGTRHLFDLDTNVDSSYSLTQKMQKEMINT